MQLDAFTDKRMKILYTLSFMRGGMAQVWVANDTSAVLNNTSSFGTLVEILALIKRTTHMQLHTLRMTLGMTAEEYMASF